MQELFGRRGWTASWLAGLLWPGISRKSKGLHMAGKARDSALPRMAGTLTPQFNACRLSNAASGSTLMALKPLEYSPVAGSAVLSAAFLGLSGAAGLVDG